MTCMQIQRFKVLFLCSLTDPPASNEVIQATISVKGDLPGNQINPAPSIQVSPSIFNFTSENCCTVAQPLVIETGECGSGTST